MKSVEFDDPKPVPRFERWAAHITRMAGSTNAFVIALVFILFWLLSGPFFDFSDTWQLVVNTGTTIITFLMVFLIQKTQNKDSVAIQIKLNELVAANENASNRLVNAEDLTEEELRILSQFYSQLAKRAMKEKNLHASHSIEEANVRHEEKMQKSGNKGR